MAEIQTLIGIVDDEMLMVEYLREIIIKMKLPGVICQTCKSGKEALATWADNPPSILVTDIMMYDMNGLDLIEAIHSQGWDTDVIIISGHDNFEYAQKAMSYGVHRYLLKPVQEEVLVSTIQNMVERYHKRQGKDDARTFSQVCRQVQCSMCAVVMEFGIQKSAEQETDTLAEKLAAFLSAKLDRREFLWRESNRFLLLLRFTGRENIRRRCQELAEIGRQWLRENTDTSRPYYYVGTGEAGKGLDALQQSRQHACYALEQGFFCNRNGVWMWNETQQNNYLPEGEDLNNFRKAVAELSVAISHGDQEDIRHCVEQYFQIQNAAMRHKNRENFFSNCSMLYLMLGLLLEEQGYDNVLQPVDTFSHSIKNCCSYRETVKYLTEDLCEVNEYIRTTIQKHNSHLVFRIKKYLMKNYEKKVNLEEISKHFYLSPTYLSSYFKKETGTTMTDYVVMLRIQKAKKLLCETNKTVEEVAKEVGYSNHNYFSVVFKKTTGYSPMQYRRKSVGVTRYENETSNESILWSSLQGKKKNLRDTVSHAFLLCVLVPVIVFNIGAFALASVVSEKLAHQQNENQSYQIQQALNSQVMDRVHFLIAMSYDDRMEVALNTNDAQAVAAVTKEYSKLNSAEDMIYVYGLSGELFYSTDTRLTRVLQPSEVEAYKAQAGIETWQLEVYKYKDKQSVRILHWIRSTTDMRIIGVVQYEFSTLEFQNCWHGTDVRHVLLQDKNGAQIYTYSGEDHSSEDTLRTDTWHGKLDGVNWELEIVSNLWGQKLFRLQLLGQQLIVVLVVFLIALLDAGRLANHLINQLFRISNSGKQAYQKDILWYFPEQFEIEEFSDLGHSFNLMAQRVENLVDQQIISVRKEEELRSQKQQMELFALQSQINPHFLYNTLECISCVVAAEEPKKAIHMISLLGKLFRYSASRQSSLVPLAEELQQLEEYFYLMDVRLNGRLTLEIFIAQELLQAQVLKLCLQPLLENVVIHAIRDSETKCHVKLHGWRVREELILCMEDDGGGIPSEKLALLQEELLQTDGKNRIGLINVNARLRLFCGDNYGIWLESQEGVGTKVYMKFPYRKTDN